VLDSAHAHRFRCVLPNVQLYTATHPLEADLRRTLECFTITIGDDCWIGGNTVICPGIIGNGCVIGAGSVVTKDIPDNSLAVGNPAK
jgi:maltose O-acetyltransferase